MLFEGFNLLALVTILSIPFLKLKGRGILALVAMTGLTVLGSLAALSVFSNGPAEIIYPGSWVTDRIPVRIDQLSAWFMLLISFTFFTGTWYGFRYLKRQLPNSGSLLLIPKTESRLAQPDAEPENPRPTADHEISNYQDKITLHIVASLLLFTSLIDLCVIQNSLVTLVIWEIMALSCFITIIFDHDKKETLKAGINFLIQSHVCMLFLTMAFMWVKIKTGSFDFTAISKFTSTQPVLSGVGLFAFFFFGFAIKAGFVPFHTWLPLAHPAAPAHISGIMSGVIIKIGIYGILRILMLIKTDMVTIGYFILFFSVITGLYGVMLAIVQHNLKKLLAYHSIENIGIIGMGIGLGCLGVGYDTQALAVAGFGGALLHTLNHSLFKSLLFFGAGNVYLTAHTLNVDALGGLIRRIPHTAYLFLIGALAICGLPPFNGFVSEFFIYSGLFKGLSSDLFLFILTMLFSILALVLIGGLALICFTKAFGMVFLGSPRKTKDVRHKYQDIKTQDTKHETQGIGQRGNRTPETGEQRRDTGERTPENGERRDLGIGEKASQVWPLYLIAAAIVFVGLFPFLLNQPLGKTIALYLPEMTSEVYLKTQDLLHGLTKIGWFSAGFAGLIMLVYLIRTRILSARAKHTDATWGCGYTGETAKMQYTASSFIRNYRKLAEPLLLIRKRKRDAAGLYPELISQETHPGDRIETFLIDKPLLLVRKFLSKFVFLQNGNIQTYILYGFIFVSLAVLLPAIIDQIQFLLEFLNHL